MLVRQPRIEDVNLSLFEFDLDLTFMVFFLNAEEQLYGRYGGRDATDPDSRQSLAGLRYSMQAALQAHREQVVPQSLQPQRKPDFIWQYPAAEFTVGCVHCHEAKEIMNDELKEQGKWSRDRVWRYPVPDNLGLRLELDRGNIVESVAADSPAAQLGLMPGDVVVEMASLPIHSFGDAQFALDHAPQTGELEVVWQRGNQQLNGQLALPEGWRKSDITWRSSMLTMVAHARVNGEDLTAEEKQVHGLLPSQLAFRQKSPVTRAAQAAGIRAEDIILGFDGLKLKMDAYDFHGYVSANYLAGDGVVIDLIRDGKELHLPMTLP